MNGKTFQKSFKTSVSVRDIFYEIIEKRQILEVAFPLTICCMLGPFHIDNFQLK
jgi:hypothetical protein